MKRIASLTLGLLVFSFHASTQADEYTDLVIWDDRPAETWDVAYPVGNGRFGAMPFGAFPREKILINEETVWARGKPKVMPEDSFQHLEKIRELEQAGKYAEADQWFEQNMQDETRPDSYQLVGWLNLEYRNVASLQKMRRSLDLKTGIYQPKIAEDGRLMEWRLPFGENEPGHRHISHVLGAYPGNQINLDKDPAMRDAVQQSIEGRLAKGGAKTGWSRAWTIGMFARLSDGARAYENLHAILERSTLDNLWDSHPPFQIDGNFGATAAVTEMLIHSHNDEIKLLPALSKQWPDGHAEGLRARGDYTVDIRWGNGVLVEAAIEGGENCTGSVRLVYGDRKKDRFP